VTCGPLLPICRLGSVAVAAVDAGLSSADTDCVIIAGAAANATGRDRVVLRKCRREL